MRVSSGLSKPSGVGAPRERYQGAFPNEIQQQQRYGTIYIYTVKGKMQIKEEKEEWSSFTSSAGIVVALHGKRRIIRLLT